MSPNFTPAATRALEAAQLWAHAEGAAEVRPVHLLHGLLQEDEGRAAVLLTRAGAAPDTLRRAFARHPPIDAAESRPSLPLSADAAAILDLARELAEEFAGERVVASEFLLLAILRRDEAARRSLEQLGLVIARLEELFLAAQGPPLRLEEPLHLAEPTEQIDTARILDAGANRAREALRVIEDYCRFVLDDAFLSGELKRLRHDLAEALAGLPPGILLAARDTRRDVGTALSTPQEQERRSLWAVVQANLKRLQEALRSLEEYAKLLGPGGAFGGRATPHLSAALEQLRYRSYTLERAIVRGAPARERLAGARLMVLLSGSACRASLEWTIREAAAGGADIIQLREKELDDRRLLERARQVRRWTREAGVLFIVNDRPDIARLAEADGVHLGQEDMPVKDARRIVGPDALIGVSTHNLDQVRQAVLDGASYLGVGPTFPSGTKDFAELAGLEFVRQATAETSLPAFVIGGINSQTIGAAVAAGARRVAVSQAICQAEAPQAVARALRQALTTMTNGEIRMTKE
ncbi:MAG TPA: thiamine phosphate synthase [Gemmataceae bacterium]|nr:thiamine phosphate synthase [Gemmataceae bacterium]